MPLKGKSEGGRSERVRKRHAAVICALLLLASVALAACGSSSSSSSSGSPATGDGEATTAAAKGPDVEAATKALAPYTGHPSAFPVTKPLSASIPAGSTFVYLGCAAPVCALTGEEMEEAIEAAGGKFSQISAGSTASSSQAAAQSAKALAPDIAFVTGVPPAFFGDSLKQLGAAGTKVTAFAVVEKDYKKYGIDYNYAGYESNVKRGQLAADWVVEHELGQEVAFYTVPEYPLTEIMLESFEAELSKLCPECSVRVSKIGGSTIGTTAPQTVVSDLQSHPQTSVAVFSIADIGDGLPAAMRAASISTPTLELGPSPTGLQDIKEGGITAGLAIDYPVASWAATDGALRLLLGEEPIAIEPPMQILEQRDITFDPSKGWTGYPNYAQMFEKLWHPAQ